MFEVGWEVISVQISAIAKGSLIMKVLHVITGLERGGAEATLNRLLSHPSRKSDVIVSLTAKGSHGAELIEKGFVVYALGIRKSLAHLLLGSARLVQIIRIERPSVVQTWMYHADLMGGLCSRIAGVDRVIWNLRSSFPRFPHQKVSTMFLGLALAGLSWWVPERVVACGYASKASHTRFGFRKSKIVVIHNGYEDTGPKPVNCQRSKNFKDLASKRTPTLVQIANYSKLKGHSDLLRALGQLRGEGIAFRLILVGRGVDSRNGTLVGMLQAHGLLDLTELFGYQEDVTEFIEAADFLVSTSRSEGFPNVVAEAMLASVPCLVSDVGESRTLVGNSGLVFRPADIEDLIQTLRHAMSKPKSWRIRKGRLARMRILTEFSIEKMANGYEQIYRRSG